MKAAEVEYMEYEVVNFANVSGLCEDEVGLEIQLDPTDDENAPAPENGPESKNKWELVYDADWGYYGIFRWRIFVASKYTPCVHFAPETEPIL